MFLKVSVEVGLLSKTAVTERAPEGLFLVVDVPHVTLEIGGDGETSLAIFTFVGLFSGVRAQVSSEIGGAGKHLPTKLARVLVLGRLVRGRV